APVAPAVPVAAPAPGGTPGQPRLVVVATNAELPLPPAKEIVVGREDPVSAIFPEIDLTPHGGEDGGVSRRHLIIRRAGNQFTIEDLHSTNYTLLNRQKLDPGRPMPLADGDEIRAGRVRLVFKVGP
ncbi:MAG: FHA domain-containing protein, partial [Chloroflexota bacterium]